MGCGMYTGRTAQRAETQVIKMGYVKHEQPTGTPQVAVKFAGDPREFTGIDSAVGNGDVRYMPAHIARATALENQDVFILLDMEVKYK